MPSPPLRPQDLKHGGIEKVVFNAFAAFVEVLWMDDVVLNAEVLKLAVHVDSECSGIVAGSHDFSLECVFVV